MKTRHIALGALAAFLAALVPANAQFPGQIPANTVLGNASGSPAPAKPVTAGTGILITGGAIAVDTSVTQCGTLEATGVMFGTGTATCDTDAAKFAWDDTNFRLSITANPGILLNEGFGLDLIGGNANAGGAARIRQTSGGGSLRAGYLDSSSYSYIDSRDAADTVNHLALNRGQGTVSVGTALGGFVNQPAEHASLISDPGGVSRWNEVWGLSGDFRGGVYQNASGKTEVRLFNTGASEQVTISADNTVISKVPGKFQAVGLRDTTAISCGTTGTDANGDLTCGAALTNHAPVIGQGAGSTAITTAALTNGQVLIGSTGADPVPAGLSAGTGISIGTGAGTITISASGAAGSLAGAAPQGRLTLVSGTPVMTSDQTGKSTVYYDCYVGNLVPVGTTLVNLTISGCEVSMGLDTGKVLSGSVYDIFGVSNGGALALCVGPAWSSTTSRGTGAGTTQIDQANGGLWTNTVSLTNCWGGVAGLTDRGPVAAGAGTYLGSLYATANGQTGMAYSPAAAAGGTDNILGLYNAYNREISSALNRDSTASWTTVNTSFEALNVGASSGLLNRITWLDGLGQSTVQAGIFATTRISNAVDHVKIGVVFDASTGTPDAYAQTQSTVNVNITPALVAKTALGLHYAQGMQAVSGNTGTYSAAGVVEAVQLSLRN